MRRRTQDAEATMFPFLSVLAAVIGILVLLIAGMSRLAIASPKERVEMDAWRPDKKSPVYVECRSAGLIIYPEDPRRGVATFVPRADMDRAGGPWALLTARLERDPTRYLMLLVRQEGVLTFEAARAGAAGIELAYEPLFGKGELRFQPRTR